MIKRIVEIAHASYVSVKDNQLVVEQDRLVVSRVPIEDIGLLLLAHPANVITQQAMSACQHAGVGIALCDEKYLPTSLMLPVAGGALHTATLHMQIDAKPRIVRAIWQSIVAAKIRAQGRHLLVRGKAASHLELLAGRVREVDAAQQEAQAAAYYWRELLGSAFRRDAHGDGFNALIDYGYAVLRAAVARAVVGTGLHPALGLFHHNRGDNFALADDLIEPLRPAVDSIAMEAWLTGTTSITPKSKRVMLELLSSSVELVGQTLPLWVALQRYTASVKAVLAGEAREVEIPVWQFSEAIAPCG